MSASGSPDYQMGGIRDRQTIAILDGIWHDVRTSYDLTGAMLIYRGVHEVHDVSLTDETWEVWKYTYDGDGNVTRIEGPLRGSWEGRESLEWGV